MNEPKPISPQQPAESVIADALPINPTLGPTLGEECETLQENLREVNEVAAGLNEDHAGKSKQLRHLNFLIEQARAHLGHMRDSIATMRKERHKLANTALGAPMVQQMLSRVTAERDKLRNELNRIHDGAAIEESQKARRELRFDERDQQIAELTFEVVTLRQQVAEFRRTNPRPAPVAAGPAPAPPAIAPSDDGTNVEIDRDDFPTRVVYRKRANG